MLYTLAVAVKEKHSSYKKLLKMFYKTLYLLKLFWRFSQWKGGLSRAFQLYTYYKATTYLIIIHVKTLHLCADTWLIFVIVNYYFSTVHYSMLCALFSLKVLSLYMLYFSDKAQMKIAEKKRRHYCDYYCHNLFSVINNIF